MSLLFRTFPLCGHKSIVEILEYRAKNFKGRKSRVTEHESFILQRIFFIDSSTVEIYLTGYFVLRKKGKSTSRAISKIRNPREWRESGGGGGGGRRNTLRASKSYSRFVSLGERSKANDVSSSMSRYDQTSDVKEREERFACFRFAFETDSSVHVTEHVDGAQRSTISLYEKISYCPSEGHKETVVPPV